MNMRKKERILSMLLIVVLIFSSMPFTAIAEGTDAGAPGYFVTGFAALRSGVAAQNVPPGTSRSELTLPDTLTATGIAFAEWIIDEDELLDDTPTATDSTATAATSSDATEEAQGEIITISGVTWQSEPEYEPDTAGTYIFTAELPEGYSLVSGVAAPVIRVEVAAATDAQTGHAITFDIPLNEFGETEFYLTEGIPVTDADLLAGVSAEDENGADVPVVVKDVDGLDMDAPVPGGEGYPPVPYVITYEAAHPVTGEKATVTRECYVTLAAVTTALIDPSALSAGTYTIEASGADVILTNGSDSCVLTSSTEIYVNNGNLTLTVNADVTVKSIKLDYGDLTIDGTNTLTLENASVSGDVTVHGTLIANSSTFSGIAVEGGGSLVIDGGTVTASNNTYNGVYIGSGNITVKNSGTLTANGNQWPGIYVTAGNLNISDGSVTANDNSSDGIWMAGGNITVEEGGTLTANVNTELGIGVASGYNLSISGGSVTANDNSNNNGVWMAGGDITIKDDGSLTAEGNFNNDVYVTGSVTVGVGCKLIRKNSSNNNRYFHASVGFTVNGTMIGYGTTVSDICDGTPTIGSTGIIIAVDSEAVPLQMAGGTTGLKSWTEGDTLSGDGSGKAIWVLENGNSGVANSVNSIFVELTDFTVMTPGSSPGGTCGAVGNEQNVNWEYNSNNKTLTIAGTGAMADYTSESNTPWYGYSSAIETVIIGDGVTNIGNYAFTDYTALTTTTIADSVTSIGIRAFRGCSNMTLTALPSGLTAIGDYAFNNCTSLALTALPDGLITIGGYAFNNCGGLALTALPDGLITIGGYAFNNCTGLGLTALPDGVTSIGNSAFYGCTGLGLTVLPTGLTTIGQYAFRGCTGLNLTALPDGVATIGIGAFYGCTGLTRLELPASLTSMGTAVFSSCTDLTTLIFTGNLPGGTLTNIVGGGTGCTVYYPSTATGYNTWSPGGNWTKTAYTVGIFTAQPTDQSKLVGETATFSVVSSDPILPTSTTLQWQVSTDNGTSWNDISGANSNTLILTNVTTGMSSYQYHCVATNAVYSTGIESTAATLTVGAAVCEIEGSAQYTNLAGALAAVTDGQTIKLLQNIDYVTGILIENKSVTFNLNGFNLNVVCDNNDVTQNGDALEVNGGEVKLTGAGEFNVTSIGDDTAGIYAYNGGKATVTNATATGTNSYGVLASDATTEVTVHGDVTATGPNCVGALSEDGANITIDGVLTASGNGFTYIQCGSESKAITDNAVSSTKQDYLEYTDGISYVWVRDLATFVNITFTAAQQGGVAGTTDSTGIALTFNQAVTGLTASSITIMNDSGQVVKGTALTSSDADKTWTIALASVMLQGDVSVSVADFGTFHVTNNSVSVTVYKKTAPNVTFTDANTGGGINLQNPSDLIFTVDTPALLTPYSFFGVWFENAANRGYTLYPTDGITYSNGKVTVPAALFAQHSAPYPPGGNQSPLTPGTYTAEIMFEDGAGGYFGYIVPFTLTSGSDVTSHTIMATAGTGGSISPSGAVSVTDGGSQTFVISPNTSYSIRDITVDGTSVGAQGSYTFNNVTADHTIHATFNYNGGGNGGNGGSGGSGSTSPSTTSTNNIICNTINVPYSRAGGLLTSSVSGQTLRNIVDTAYKAGDGSKMVKISYNQVFDAASLNSLVLTFDASQLKADENVTFIIETPFGMLNFTTEQMLQWFGGDAFGTYTITLEKSSLKVDVKMGGNSVVGNSLTPMARIGVPYTLQTGETTANLAVTDKNGRILPTSGYENGMVYADIFAPDTYEAVTATPSTFSDTASHPAKEGWSNANKDLRKYVYYTQNGNALTGWQTIGGVRYYFGSDGVMHTGWLDIDDTWYYFYPNGMMIAGEWAQIGGKWYYFYEDGTLAVDTTIDGYEIGADGVRK